MKTSVVLPLTLLALCIGLSYATGSDNGGTCPPSLVRCFKPMDPLCSFDRQCGHNKKCCDYNCRKQCVEPTREHDGSPGMTCRSDRECKAPLMCREDKCTNVRHNEHDGSLGTKCKSDRECKDPLMCREYKCTNVGHNDPPKKECLSDHGCNPPKKCRENKCINVVPNGHPGPPHH